MASLERVARANLRSSGSVRMTSPLSKRRSGCSVPIGPILALGAAACRASALTGVDASSTLANDASRRSVQRGMRPSTSPVPSKALRSPAGTGERNEAPRRMNGQAARGRRRAPGAYLLCVLLLAALPALVAATPDPLPAAPDLPPTTRPKPKPTPTPPAQPSTATPDPLPAAPDLPAAAKPKTTFPVQPPATRPPTQGFSPGRLTPGSTLIPQPRKPAPSVISPPRALPPLALPNLRVPSVLDPAVTPTGQNRPDRTFLLFVGTLAGVALAGVGAIRLARRGTTAGRAATSPTTFVFPPAAEAPNTGPAPIAQRPFHAGDAVVPLESARATPQYATDRTGARPPSQGRA